jgi:hypothetical protein
VQEETLLTKDIQKGSHSSAKLSSQFKSIGNGLRDPEIENMNDLNMIVGGYNKVYEVPATEE